MSEPALQPPSAVWGRMQIWCAGVSIGDFSNPHCALYDSYLEFKELSNRLPSLWLDEFSNLADLELWNLLDGALYGFHGELELDDSRTIDEIERDGKRYGAFDFLTNWGEQFDRGGKSFILCTPGQTVRILNRSLPQGRGIALEASVFHTSKAIREFLKWFEQEASRLGHPVT